MSQYSLRNTLRVSNSLDPDQARHFAGPDLGLNCLQKLSADDTSGHRVNEPAHEILVLLAMVSSEDSDKPVQRHSLARAFATGIHKM